MTPGRLMNKNSLSNHFNDNYREENTFIEDIKAKAIMDQKKADSDIEIVNFMENQEKSIKNFQNHNSELQKQENIGHNKLKAFENKYGSVLVCDKCDNGRNNTAIFGFDKCDYCDGVGFIAPRGRSENILIAVDEGMKDGDETVIVTFKKNDKGQLEVLDIKSKK